MSCNSYLEREIYRQYYIHHIKCTHVFLQTTREIFALKHHHLSLHITILFILDVANIFLITVIYEDINIDIISYTIVFSCNPQEKYLHKNTVTYLSWYYMWKIYHKIQCVEISPAHLTKHFYRNFLLLTFQFLILHFTPTPTPTPTVVMYCTVLYCTVLYCTGRYAFSWRKYVNHNSDNFINK